jgi:hypothetical protein
VTVTVTVTVTFHAYRHAGRKAEDLRAAG